MKTRTDYAYSGSEDKVMTRTDYAYSGSEDKVMMRTDYACSGSEDKVTKRCLAKGYFQDWTRVVEIDP